ncbi:hypothetical protein D1224_09635 [Henriciella barbarensis]|uniref:Uncharacterized protein n=1 Tax=Henriciella barbarensis TaxID=86342 RepID=A0A399R1V2_9PROT|nr:hypothetical protein [Henriciella barbarensis]RIJ24474.1 hypothetical protein D1224_09635 [Henriciella barbarensis]
MTNFRLFWSNQTASIAVNFALLIAPLFGVVVCVFAVQQFSSAGKRIQSELDIAALSAAQVFIDLYDGTDQSRLEEATRRVRDIERNFQKESQLFQNVHFEVVLDEEERQASVKASGTFRVLPRDADVAVARNSVAAAILESRPVCILALEESRVAIEFLGRGKVKAKDCVVWSNSDNFQSIRFQGDGKVETEQLCTVGRAGRAGRYDVKPEAVENCQPVNNPLTQWTGPAFGACDFENVTHDRHSTIVLAPGVYCGGLEIQARKVKLRSGTYIIRDGPLTIQSEKEIEGDKVGIFLTGKNSSVTIESEAKIELQSMETGPMAGIAIAHDPESDEELSSIVSGRTDLKIGGVIYLPKHDLTYWGESDTQAASPVTTIIVRALKIGGSAYLEVKNDNKKASYAPVLETGHGNVSLVR